MDFKPLPLNLAELSFVLHRGDDLKMECYLNLQDGSILNIPTNEKLLQRTYGVEAPSSNINRDYFVKQAVNDKENLLYIPDLFKQHLFELMSLFANDLAEQSMPEAELLWNMIRGEGGYQAFYQFIKKNKRLYDNYILFRDFYFEKKAIDWLGEHKILPVPVTVDPIIN